jgi:hypothetical protein
MKPCGLPGLNRLCHCIEPEGHDGPHTYQPKPVPDTLPSDELEEIKTLLVQSCPDWVCGDITTPRPTCCIFHKAAEDVHEIQKILREMHL